MKILRLTTSNDSIAGAGALRPAMLAEKLTELLGEPVEIVTKRAWPDARLAPAVERWIEKEDPDITWLQVQNFWYDYLSVPKRLERLLGPVGRRLSNAGLRAADNPRLSQTAVFRAGRHILQRTVGGDPHFSAREVVQVTSDVARICARREGMLFVAWGPFAYSSYAVSRRGERRAEARRQYIRSALTALAGELHFDYFAPERPYWQLQSASMHTDHFHYSADWNADSAEREFQFLKGVLERHEIVPARSAPVSETR